MRASRGIALAGFLLAAGFIRPAGAPATVQAAEAEVLRARLADPYIQGQVSVRITVDSYSEPQEILDWKQLIDSGDVKGFYRAFGRARRGSIVFTGGLGLNIKLSAAQVSGLPGGGRRIELFGEAKSISRASVRKIYRDFPFLAVVVETDAGGAGEGRIYEAVKIALSPQGTIVLQGFSNPPKLLTSVESLR